MKIGVVKMIVHIAKGMNKGLKVHQIALRSNE